jgi:hypothetical protein
VPGHVYRIIQLSGDSQKSSSGRLTLDLTDYSWVLSANGLNPTVGNQSYVVWVYGSDKVAHEIGAFKLTSSKPKFDSIVSLPKMDLQHQVKFLITIESEPAVSIPGHNQMVGTLNP